MKFLLSLLLLASCNQNPSKERPLLTVAEYDKEVQAIQGVIYKFIGDSDPSKVHDVALGIESTFAINCKPIADECIQYHNILTAIIKATNDRKYTIEEKVEIFKMTNDLNKALTSSRTKLVEDWKKYK